MSTYKTDLPPFKSVMAFQPSRRNLKPLWSTSRSVKSTWTIRPANFVRLRRSVKLFTIRAKQLVITRTQVRPFAHLVLLDKSSSLLKSRSSKFRTTRIKLASLDNVTESWGQAGAMVSSVLTMPTPLRLKSSTRLLKTRRRVWFRTKSLSINVARSVSYSKYCKLMSICFF